MSVDLDAITHDLTEVEPGFWVGPPTDDLHYDASRSEHWKEAEEASGWHRHRAEVIVDAVTAYPPAGTILELGAGNGFVARALRDEGFDVVPAEPVEEAARAAYERGLRPVVCSTLEGAAFAPASLPAVGMFDVLEHVDDDLDLLRELHRLLVPRGRLYLTVPKHRWLWSRHDVQAGHRRRYSTKKLVRVVEGAGFEIEHQTSLFGALVPFMLMRASFLLVTSDDTVRDPTAENSLLGRYFDKLLGRERERQAQRPRHLGTSLLVVARA